jgi:hypothetical protein
MEWLKVDPEFKPLYYKRKEVHFAHSSRGSKTWHRHGLCRCEGLMADGITMARAHVEDGGHMVSWEAREQGGARIILSIANHSHRNQCNPTRPDPLLRGR